jgi:hypothetical protein
MNKKMILIFNTDGSKLITVQDYDSEFESNLIAGNLKHKVMEYDIDNEYYWGTFDSGTIRSLNDYPLLEELAVEELTNKSILIKYPIHKQLNIIAECLENAGIPLTDEFIAMRTFVKGKADNHNTAVQTYKNNPGVYSFVEKPALPTDE